MKTSSVCVSVSWVSAAAIAAAMSAVPAAAQVTGRASVDSAGAQASGQSYRPSVSANGRFVAFASDASNLVAGDTNGADDVFVRDLQTGMTERVSVDSGALEGNGSSYDPSISADGRYVAFESAASNLVTGDTNGTLDIFVHDRVTGTTERVSVDSLGVEASTSCQHPSISGDGRYVAFHSWATNLVAGDTNGWRDVFVHDRQTGTTERASVDSNEAQANTASDSPSMSADGRYVAFVGYATNLVAGDTNGVRDIFVRDLQAGTTERVSLDSSGAQVNNVSESPAISEDGRYVAFKSIATNLVPGDTNAFYDVFVRDRQLGTTERASVDSAELQANDQSGVFGLAISADGRYVTFTSYATNLVSGDTNAIVDIFVRDRTMGTTERVSIDSNGAQTNDVSYYPVISGDGRRVYFESEASNLVLGDTNGALDIFVRDRNAAGFSSTCEPGIGGVIACPCSNPPSGPGRGCNNSSSTGGAILSASGVAYLSMDSLVFTTSGEKPTATSIVMQGHALAANGIAFGQGVRCVAGTLKRLYTKTASGGSITAPNLGAGDPTVSARSAALGDPILAGQSRWYLVYYRDPTVLGGCPAASTFNATQTGRVQWSP